MGDLLYNFTEWLRGTSLVDISLAISEWKLSHLMAENFWAIPAVQVIHILSIAAAFGAILLMHSRVAGFAGMNLTVQENAARYVPWVWAGFIGLIVSGLLMIVGEPVRELINPIFWIKMVLVIVAILLSLSFHNGAVKRIGSDQAISGGLKATSVFLIVLWCVIMLCGRWIAYAPV